MDGDGDLDLVCGNSKGKLVYCENIALPGQPADFKLTDPAWLSIDVGDFSAPQLFDVDLEGLTDMICGKKNGTVSFYKNTGSKQLPQFTEESQLFGGVDVTDTMLSYYGYSVPCFYRDKQGETVLFVGSEFGDIFVYDQIDNNLDGNFRQLGTIPGIKDGWRSAVAIGNLNNDTLTDMLVGNYSGGLDLYYGKADKIFGIGDPAKRIFSTLHITPNPARSEVSIAIDSEMNIKTESLIIQGIEGKVARIYSNVHFPMLIDISNFKNGIYLVSVKTNSGSVTGKLVICR